MWLHLPQREGQKYMGNHSLTAGIPAASTLSEPTPKALVWGQENRRASSSTKLLSSLTLPNVLMTGVTRCNVVSQVIISIIGMNSSQTHEVMFFTAGKTVLG